MAVICELDCGWLVDHKLAIDRVYYNTYTLPEQMTVSSPETTSVHYHCLPDLFDIHQIFMMDSQFDKLKKNTCIKTQPEETASVSDTGSARRKKRVGCVYILHEIPSLD